MGGIREADSLDSPGAADHSHTPEEDGGLAAVRHTLHSPAVGALAEGSRTHVVAVGSHNYSCCSYSPVAAALMDKRVLGHTALPSRLTPRQGGSPFEWPSE